MLKRVSLVSLTLILSTGALFCLDEQSQVAVVKTEVIETTDLGDEVLGRLKILHVYRGSVDVDQIELKSRKKPGAIRMGTYPEFQVGETAFWQIYKDPKHGWIPSRNSKRNYNLPIGYNGNRNQPGFQPSEEFLKAERLATLSSKIFEGDYKYDHQKQFKTLKKLISEGKEFEAVWAVEEIASGDFPTENVYSFLKFLLSNIYDHPLGFQVKLDIILCNMDLFGWMKSEERTKLLNNWIGNIPDYTRDQLGLIRARIYGSFQRGELTEKTLHNLLRRSLEVHDNVKVLNKYSEHEKDIQTQLSTPLAPSSLTPR